MLAQQDADADVRTEDTPADPEDRAPDRIREIDWTAGHGVARAYGYAAIAAAYNCRAELLKGGTHSGRIPLTVAVYAPSGAENADEILTTVNDIYDALAPEAEKYAKERRAHVRQETPDTAPTGYQVNRFTRGVIAGFLQGAASVLRTEHAIKPEPYRIGSRARVIDESAHRIGLNAGRAYARNTLLPLLQQDSERAANAA